MLDPGHKIVFDCDPGNEFLSYCEYKRLKVMAPMREHQRMFGISVSLVPIPVSFHGNFTNIPKYKSHGTSDRNKEISNYLNQLMNQKFLK